MKAQPFCRAATAIIAAVALGATQPAGFANPSGASIRFGDISIQQQGDLLQVYQGTNQGIIDWNSFSIDPGQTTQFIQPGVNSATLNRVTGQLSSNIYGKLLANGRVFLINPNGILIGQSGMINVAGFTASTLDLSDQNFLDGGDMTYRGDSQARVVNLGSISAFDGDVFLVGAQIVNSGSISAPRGTVGLAAGNDVLIAESGSERVFVRGASGGSKEDGVLNRGTIEANVAELKSYGGNIYGMAVKNEGRVAATGVSREGGQIFLRAGGGSRVRTSGTLVAKKSDGGGTVTVESGPGGVTEVAGTIDVSSEVGNGGSAVVLGESVGILEGGLVIADGETGGGSIYIGGGRRGQNPDFMNATDVNVAEGARLTANAIGAGDGGEVIVYAGNRLEFSGQASSRGGALMGNGGFIELSGKNEVVIPALSRQIDLSSPRGLSGTLLIDPGFISIVPSSAESEGSNSNEIVDGEINSFLASMGNLMIEAFSEVEGGPGDIVLQDMVDINWSTSNRLSFTAEGDFSMLGSSTINGGGDLVIKTSTINLAGGTISSTGSLIIEPFDAGSAINIGAGAVDSGLQLTDVEVGLFGNGFQSITIGNSSFGYGAITVNAVTFLDPTLLATPGSGGEIFVNGQITGADNASIVLDGAGPAGEFEVEFEGSATTYLSADIVTYGNEIIIDDDVRVAAAAALDTTGDGFSAGADVSVFGKIDSFIGMEEEIATPKDFKINAGTGGEIFLEDHVGGEDSLGAIDFDGRRITVGNYPEVEVGPSLDLGLDLNTASTVNIDVQEDFLLGASSGIFAVGDITINANQGAMTNTGNFNGIEIRGGVSSADGAITLTGTAGNSVGNTGVWIRGGPGVIGDLAVTVTGTGQAVGASGVVIDAPVESRTAGVQIKTNGGPIKIGNSLTAVNDVELIGSMIGNTEFIFTGEFDVDSIVGGGGYNTIDLSAVTASLFVDLDLTEISGSVAPADLRIGSFSAINSFVGSGGTFNGFYGTSGSDLVRITSETGGSIDIPDGVGTRTIDFVGFNWVDGREGSDQFEVNPGVAKVFNGTLAGGDGSDDFRFVSGMANDIEGDDPLNLKPGDDPMAADTLDYSGLSTQVSVDIGASTATGVVNNFSGVEILRGGAGTTDEIRGTAIADVFTLTGPGSGTFASGMVHEAFSGFERLKGLGGSDQFVMNGGSIGSVDGGIGTDRLDYSNLSTPIAVNVGAASGTGAGSFTDIETFLGGSGTMDVFNGTSGADLFAVSAPGSGTLAFGMNLVDFSGFEDLRGEAGNDRFAFTGTGSVKNVQGGMDTDTLDFSGAAGSVELSFLTNSATGAGFGADGFSEVESFLGSGLSDLLRGTNSEDEFSVASANGGTFTGLLGQAGQFSASFEGFEELSGEGGSDQFKILPAGFIGAVSGGINDTDVLDWSSHMTGVFVDLGQPATNWATGVGVFTGVESLIGGSGLDVLSGTAGTDNFTINSVNGGMVNYSMSDGSGGATPASVNFDGFEKLEGAGGDDNFLMQPTGSIISLDGGGERDTLNYGAFSNAIFADFGSGSATAVSEIRNMEVLVGGAGSDTLTATPGNDIFAITGENQGSLNQGEFFSIENLAGAGGSDQFLFSNQATVASVDGGSGFDLLQIDDRNLTGANSYTIGTNSISRNPTYTFSGLEALTLLLGSGDDTVTTAGNGLVISINGGSGFDRLDFLPFQYLGSNPMVVGGSSIYAINFEGPFDPGVVPGTVLSTQVGNTPTVTSPPDGEGGDTGDTGLGAQALAGLSGSLGNAFAAISSQSVILGAGGEQYKIPAPMSLDGSNTVPPLIVASNLKVSLEPLAWAELAAAIVFSGPISLVMNDGPFAIDLTGLPPEELVAVLQENLKSESGRELIAALELNIVIPITSLDGAISILAIPVPVDAASLAMLAEMLGGASYSELTSALDE